MRSCGEISRRAIHAGLLAAFATAVLYAQTVSPCAKGVPDNVVCYSGQDDNGTYYGILMPKDWNGTLVLYMHGGPGFAALGPQALVSMPAVALFPLLEGAAVAASVFRDYGYVIRQDAEDTEKLRRIFIDAFGSPKRTVALGTSYGGIVAARLMELYGSAADGLSNYDGAMVGCGALAGYRRIGCPWLDFRAVYQYYCQNHPLPEEPQFDLWWGLNPESGPLDAIYSQTSQMLIDRANACTGFLLPPDQRSEEQRRNLANILNVMRIVPESLFQLWITDHSTSALYDIANRMRGLNTFSNLGVVYQGSTDDNALNSGVARYGSNPDALAAFMAETDPTGYVTAPVLTLHGIGDPQAIVENETVYRETFQNAGTGDYLFQTYLNMQGHCPAYSTSELQASMHALLTWIDTKVKPTQGDVVASCEKYRVTNGDQCRFVPDYQPGPWESRVYPRVP